MDDAEGAGIRNIHCRIGSSENAVDGHYDRIDIHCRIGSSEIHFGQILELDAIHCRIGSSENDGRT